MITLYSLLVELVTWSLLVPYTVASILSGRAERATLRQRLGSFADLPPSRRRLLIHAVSAGEMNGASALVHEMAQRGWTFVLCAGNAHALATARIIASHHPEVEDVRLLPWDRVTIQRWLGAIRPAAVVVVETEIWPNLFCAAAELSIPLVIAGGRIEPRAAARYRATRFFFERVLRRVAFIGATAPDEAARFTAAGASPGTIAVLGSLKADACLASHEPAGPREQDLVVAANTHAGEELLIARAFAQACEGNTQARLILAPRHPERAAAIERELRGCGIAAGRLRDGERPRVAIVDRMGALRSCYPQAQVAILGGTFCAIGGHDPLEAARGGCAIVAGPERSQVVETLRTFSAAGAVVDATADSLSDTIGALLRDRVRLASLQQSASIVAAQRGAARATADRIEQLAGA